MRSRKVEGGNLATRNKGFLPESLYAKYRLKGNERLCDSYHPLSITGKHRFIFNFKQKITLNSIPSFSNPDEMKKV